MTDFKIFNGGPIETNALIIGAGPVGLYQVVQLGQLGIRAHVVDSQPVIGGQCTALYPDQPIYDLPGVSGCSGRELADSLYAQTGPFGATFHLDQQVTTVLRHDEHHFYLRTSKQRDFLARTLFIAGGFGAFQPRRLALPGLNRFEPDQVFHRVQRPDLFQGRPLVIVGNSNAALQWAMNLVGVAARITVVQEAEPSAATPERARRFQAMCDAGLIRTVRGDVIGFDTLNGRLSALRVQPEGPPGQEPRSLPLDALLVLRGLAPDLGPIVSWELALQRNQLVVDIETFETNVPGIFAVGDIVSYPGKRRQLLSGFHEASMAAHGALHRIFPDQPMSLTDRTHEPLSAGWSRCRGGGRDANDAH